MAYTRNHFLLRFGGTSAQGQETWSCGVRLAPNGNLSPEAMLTLSRNSLDALVTACSNYVASGSADFNPLCRLEYVKFNAIAAASGDYLFPNDPNERLLEQPFPTGSASVASPLQVAYVVTLRGTYRRGPAAFGRWYVPTGDASVTSTGVMSAAQAQALADRAGTFLEDIQLVGTEPSDVLRVRLFGDGVGGPRESVVRQVDVGNVYDTQRRRRRQIEETYFTSATWVEPTD